MDPKPKDIKVYGSIFTMSGDGQAAYAQQIWDDEKQCFITDDNWVTIPALSNADIDEIINQ